MNQEELHALEEARREALSLTGAATVSIPTSEQALHPARALSALPLIWIDTKTRPDIADLPRVHRLEGPGTLGTSWVYDFYHPSGSVTFYFRFQLRAPVEAAFIVAFPLPKHEGILERIISCKDLLLFTGPPPPWTADPLTYRLHAMEKSRSWLDKLHAMRSPLFLSPWTQAELNEGLHVRVEHPELTTAFDYWLRES